MEREPIIEAKVKTSSAAAAVVGLVLGWVSLLVYGGEPVPQAVAEYFAMLLTPLVTGGATFLVGWLTRHTPRSVVSVEEH